LLFVEYAVNGSLYNFLQQPQSEQLTFENTVQWAKDIARGKYCEFICEFIVYLFHLKAKGQYWPLSCITNHNTMFTT